MNMELLLNKPYVNEVTLTGQIPLLASWTFDTVLKGFRSFNAENLGPLGQRATKLPALKVGGLKKKSADPAFTAEAYAGVIGPGSSCTGVKSFSKFDRW